MRISMTPAEQGGQLGPVGCCAGENAGHRARSLIGQGCASSLGRHRQVKLSGFRSECSKAHHTVNLVACLT